MRFPFAPLAIDHAGFGDTALRLDHDLLAAIGDIAISLSGEHAVAELDNVAVRCGVDGVLDRGEVVAAIRKDEVRRRDGGQRRERADGENGGEKRKAG
ncbi:MAG: hypothetical protein QUU85_19720, partial [Candidatus Eisenbacteria bacterium]|nr:hypothetical protein [Candidatus Eisenbacteria bacterium]